MRATPRFPSPCFQARGAAESCVQRASSRPSKAGFNRRAPPWTIREVPAFSKLFPTTRGIRPRGGSLRHATLDNPVQSLMVWRSGTLERIFAGDAQAIYNVTAPASPMIQPAADVWVRAAVSTAQRCSRTTLVISLSPSMAATAGCSMRARPGPPRRQSPAYHPRRSPMSGCSRTACSSSRRTRVNAWCLAVDAIGGAAIQISLSGVFKKGGSLLFGETWSIDAGDGLNDVCVFISTTGEVAAPFG